MSKTIFIAHRGAPSPQRRENSEAAFERAVSSGRFEYIEMDVQRTRTDDEGNREPVIAHDPTLDTLYEQQRIPKGERKFEGVSLSSLSYEMIRGESLDVITLRQALRITNGHKVNLEIKDEFAVSQTVEVVEDVIAQTSSKWKQEHFLISSFNWEILSEVRNLMPDVEIALLYGFRNLPRLPFSNAKEVGATTVHMNKWLAPVLAPYFAFRGIKNRYVYTVNNPLAVRFLRLLGVNGFTTDSVTLPDRV